jgi:hypothetical protein
MNTRCPDRMPPCVNSASHAVKPIIGALAALAWSTRAGLRASSCGGALMYSA